MMYYHLLLFMEQQARRKAPLRENLAPLLVGNNGVRHSERNCADRSSHGWVIRSNSAAARRFRLSGRNRLGPPCAARNQTRNGMELRGDVLFANLLIPTREITAGHRGKRVFARLVADCILNVSLISV